MNETLNAPVPGDRVELVTDKPDGFGVLTDPSDGEYVGSVSAGTVGTLEAVWPGHLGTLGWMVVRLDDGRVVPVLDEHIRSTS